jgi:hypothetical protein
MRTTPLHSIALAAALIATSPAGAAGQKVIVVCAPGYPGTTEQARSVMDSFASSVERAAGWPPGGLMAMYFETADAGIEALRSDDSILALAPLPFVLENEEELGLRPRLRGVPVSGPDEAWSLVAQRGRVASPEALDGWEVTGVPGYSPAFVRGPVLERWGRLPRSAQVTFTSRVVTALRRAASGEKVAVLVDSAQSEALTALPFGKDLEIVTRSQPFPSALLCTVGGREREDVIDPLLNALLTLHESAGGLESLQAMRMVRFDRADLTGFAATKKVFGKASSGPSSR